MPGKPGRKPPSQADLNRKALDLVENSDQALHRPENSPTADEGTSPIPRDDYPNSGAFDAEGQRPVLERSRKVR